ncbi:MAG: hypothetical protein ACRDNW_14570 [Trebonia sp.]
MPRQPREQHDAIKRISLAVAGGGGVTGLGTLLVAVAHDSSPVTAVIVAAVIAFVVLPIALPGTRWRGTGFVTAADNHPRGLRRTRRPGPSPRWHRGAHRRIEALRPQDLKVH